MRVVPAREAGWDAVETVFQAEASARNCWCQFHVLANSEAASTDRVSRRAKLAQQIDALDPPRGLSRSTTISRSAGAGSSRAPVFGTCSAAGWW